MISTTFNSTNLYQTVLYALTLQAVTLSFLDETAYLVLDEDTGQARNYLQLFRDPKTKNIWKIECVKD